MTIIDTKRPLVWTVKKVMSATECGAMIDLIERMGPDEAPITTAFGVVRMPKVRNNARVMFDFEPWADILLERLRSDVMYRRSDG